MVAIMQNTFGDSQVYQQLPMQPLQADEFLRATCSRPFLRRYKWGINLRSSSLPIAYLLLKQKKDSKGARPIISYINFCMLSSFVPQPLHWMTSCAPLVLVLLVSTLSLPSCNSSPYFFSSFRMMHTRWSSIRI